MDSVFGDHGDENDGGVGEMRDEHELPSGDELAIGENLFGMEEDGGVDGDGAPIKVELKQKRVIRNPRPRLTVDRLQGPRGIQTIEEYYKDMRFKGKGYEKQDLDEVMRRLQHWGHRMYATYKFDDVLTHIERLGKKRPLQVHMSRYRLGMLEPMTVPTGDGGYMLADDGDEDGAAAAADEPFDEFDALLGEQIAISKLAPRTPAAASSSRQGTDNYYTPMSISTIASPSFMHGAKMVSTPYTSSEAAAHINDSDLAQPLPPTQPSTPAPAKPQLSTEQLARIAENRRLAQERLRAKQQQNIATTTII